MACCIVFNMYSLSSLTKILLRNILSYLGCLSPLTHFVLEVKSTLYVIFKLIPVAPWRRVGKYGEAQPCSTLASFPRPLPFLVSVQFSTIYGVLTQTEEQKIGEVWERGL